MPIAYEATISCNAEKCKTADLTSDPRESGYDAATEVETKAHADGWEHLAKLYWCPLHIPNTLQKRLGD